MHKDLNNVNIAVITDCEKFLTKVKNYKHIFKNVYFVKKDDFLEFYTDCLVFLDILIFDLNEKDIYFSENLNLKHQSCIFLAPNRKTYLKIANKVCFGSSAVLFKPICFGAILDNIKLLLPSSQNKLIFLNENISVDISNRQIYKNSKPIFLSFSLHKLFFLLLLYIEKLVYYEIIEDYIYNNQAVAKINIQNLIGRLKKELNLNITTVYKSGYILHKK